MTEDLQKIKDLLSSPLEENQKLGVHLSVAFKISKSDMVFGLMNRKFEYEPWQRNWQERVIQYTCYILGRILLIEINLTTDKHGGVDYYARVHFHINFGDYSMGGYFYPYDTYETFTYTYFDMIRELENEIHLIATKQVLV